MATINVNVDEKIKEQEINNIETIDKNIDFINDCGSTIKSMQFTTERKVQAQGEQISSIISNGLTLQQYPRASRRWPMSEPQCPMCGTPSTVAASVVSPVRRAFTSCAAKRS